MVGWYKFFPCEALKSMCKIVCVYVCILKQD